MAVHDEAWDMPHSRHGPASSYAAAVVPPSVDPEGGTLVQLPCVAKEWIPYVIGALDQLRLPSTWDVSDDDEMLLVLQRAEQLRGLFASWGACEVLAFRCNPATGAPEFSVDAGAHWTAMPGCFIGPAGATGATGAAGATGATGATGPAGTFDPGSPPTVPGVGINQQACNVAGYLSVQVIQASLAQAVTSITALQPVVTFAGALAGAVFGLGALSGILAAAADLLYIDVTAGTLSDYSAASTDAALASSLTCAIYGAIRTDGGVTAGNFAAVLTAIGAVTYAHPAVISTIHDYVAQLGATGIRQAQAMGALAVYDCSACSTPPTAVALAFDGSSSQGWAALGANLQSAADFLVGGWINVVAPQIGAQAFYLSGYDGVHSDQVQLYYDATKHLSAYWDNGVGANLDLHSATLVTGGNHLVAMQRAGTTLTLWVDGVVVATGTLPSGTFAHAGGGTSIGGVSGVESKLGAVLWNWAYYLGTFTTAQHAAWFAQGRFLAPPSAPAHRWLMGEGTGTVIADTGSVAGAAGTLQGNMNWTTHS